MSDYPHHGNCTCKSCTESNEYYEKLRAERELRDKATAKMMNFIQGRRVMHVRRGGFKDQELFICMESGITIRIYQRLDHIIQMELVE